MYRILLLVSLISSILACSPNEGSGQIKSERLFALQCFTGTFDLKPTFFASNPYRDSQTLRVQRGNDFIENSDGISLLIDDTTRIRQQLGSTLQVGLPPEVTPPGILMVPQSNPPLVHLTFYLNETCHGQNISLYAISGTIVFEELFNGNVNERKAAEKFTNARFDVIICNPRDASLERGTINVNQTSRLIGSFQFYFQRGQPGQPFP